MPILAMQSGQSFLTTGQRVAAGVGLAVGTLGTAAVAARLGATPDAVSLFAVVTAECAIADVGATLIRHPGAELDWEFRGRGGHVIAVALGLGMTFGLFSGAIHSVVQAVPEAAAAFRGNIEIFAKLFLGIEPWVVYDALTNPAHEGRRLQVLRDETIKNVAGSATATVIEPVAGGFLSATLGKLGALWRGLSDQLTTVVGYLTVLMAGWRDYGSQGLSAAEAERVRGQLNG